MMLSVRELDSQSTDFGLRKRNVERSVKSRLRSARLYTSDPEKAQYSNLYIDMTTIPCGTMLL